MAIRLLPSETQLNQYSVNRLEINKIEGSYPIGTFGQAQDNKV